VQYITFDEYKELGGTVEDEATFNSLQLYVESKMNYITFGRLEALFEDDIVYKEIGQLEVELIKLANNDEQSLVKTGVQSYSNGIESITYSGTETEIEKERIKRISSIMQTYLWKYPQLFYTGRSERWMRK
jgi:hypothetical protein